MYKKIRNIIFTKKESTLLNFAKYKKNSHQDQYFLNIPTSESNLYIKHHELKYKFDKNNNYNSHKNKLALIKLKSG